MKKTWLMVLAAISLSACVKITDVSKEEKKAAPTSEVQPQVIELEQPNQYQVVLPVFEGVQVVRRYIKEKAQVTEALPAKIQAGKLLDDQVQPGETYVYELGSIQGGSFQIAKSYELKIPKDKWVQGEVILNQDEDWSGYHRIQLDAGSIITTKGYRLTIQGEKFKSMGAIIRTFPENDQAPVGFSGSSGGHIQILTQTSEGEIRFEMRGQHGGNGIDGASIPQETSSTSTGYVCNPFQPCSWEDPNKTGASGGNGTSGGNGGSTGQVELMVQEQNHLRIQTLLEPGRGAEGGRAGKGQPVGLSIKKPGADGQPGAHGANGEKGDLCLKDVRGLVCWSQGELFLKMMQ